MRYIDLESLKFKLDSLVQALNDYETEANTKIEQNAENLETYKNENAFNLAELDDMVLNGISFNDLDEDLQNSIINAKNAGIDITELIARDNYLNDIKANKSDVYTKTEIDARLSKYYTKSETDEAINNAIDSIGIDEVFTTLNNYITNSDITVEELNRQVNNLKKMYHNAEEISSIQTFQDINVVYPNEVTLPDSIEVTLANGNTQSVNVEWKNNGIVYDIGEHHVEGVLILPLTIANSNNFIPSINVNVTGAPTAIDSIYTQSLAIDYGTPVEDLNLSDEVVVKLYNGNEFSLHVTWDLHDYEQYTTEDQEISGEVQLIEEISNPKHVKALLILSVANKSITSIESSTRTYERDDVVEFDLPKELEVTLNDSSTRIYQVEWNTSNIDTTKLGDVTIEGTLLNVPINITSSVIPECTITFTENPKNIVQVGRVADIEVAYNVEFEAIDLEDTIEVVTYDDTVSSAKVIWDRGLYDQTTPGDYFIVGRLDASPLKNFDNMKLERVIRVSEETFYEYDWSFKVGIPNSVSEISGLSALINKAIPEKYIYGPYDQNIDDYIYSKRKIEIRYLGATLQNFDQITLNIDESKIVKSGIIDTYGEDGIRIPLGTQSDAIKDDFDSKVEAVHERSLRSFDYYAGDVLTFENKTLSNQILLIRKSKNNYIKGE